MSQKIVRIFQTQGSKLTERPGVQSPSIQSPSGQTSSRVQSPAIPVCPWQLHFYVDLQNVFWTEIFLRQINLEINSKSL